MLELARCVFEYVLCKRERARAARRRAAARRSRSQYCHSEIYCWTYVRRGWRQLEIMDEEKLIGLVQRFECLYNISSPTYSDRMLKANAWERISQEMGKPGKFK